MRLLRLVLVTSAAAVSLTLSGCGPACDGFEVGFTNDAQGAATPRAAVDDWLADSGSEARNRDPGSWHETSDPLAFSNGEQIVKVADLTAVTGGSGYLVESCQ